MQMGLSKMMAIITAQYKKQSYISPQEEAMQYMHE